MPTTPSLETYIEAILFYVAEPMTVRDLAAFLEQPQEAVEAALENLAQTHAGHGVQFMRMGEHVELRTASSAASLIEKLEQEELSRELSHASVETLAIVLYHGPTTRSEIDYIRGVQSQSSLRALGARGLVEKVVGHDGIRGNFYRATTAALAHFGVRRVEELPNYRDMHDAFGLGRASTGEEV